MKWPDERTLAERVRSVEQEPHRSDEVIDRCPRCGRWAWLRRGVHAFLLSPCGYCHPSCKDCP